MSREARLAVPKRSSDTRKMDEVLYQEALDETGTVLIGSLTESDNGSVTLRENTVELEEEGTVDTAEELSIVHGISSGKKPDGVTRMIYENANSFNTRISGNEKVEKAKEVIDKLEADVVCYNEHRVNTKYKENHNGFNQLFLGRERISDQWWHIMFTKM